MKLISVRSNIKFNPNSVSTVVFLPTELKTAVVLDNGMQILSDYDFRTTCEIVEKELTVDEANLLKVRNELNIEVKKDKQQDTSSK